MTTPQKLAFIDVAKGVRMFSKLKVWYSTMWSSVRFNINITYQIYKNKCHLFIHIGTLYSCSWEHVPLWCWWETLLSIWQRFWFSGMHVIQLLVFLIWKKKGNILLMAIQVLSLLSVYFENSAHTFAGCPTVWNSSSLWSSHQTNCELYDISLLIKAITLRRIWVIKLLCYDLFWIIRQNYLSVLLFSFFSPLSSSWCAICNFCMNQVPIGQGCKLDFILPKNSYLAMEEFLLCSIHLFLSAIHLKYCLRFTWNPFMQIK